MSDLRRAIAEAQAAGSVNTELRARNNLAWLVVADDPRVTVETARAGFELANEMGVRDMAVQLADVACAAAIDSGDWDWALETAADLEQRGISAAYRIDLASIGAVIRALRGEGTISAARLDDGLDLSSIDPQVLAGVTHMRAWIAFLGGSFEEARMLATQAVSESVGAERARQAQLAGRAALWAGNHEAARAALGMLDDARVTGRATNAARATLEAGLATTQSDPSAMRRYRDAADQWRGLDLPLQLALCLLDARRHTGAHPGDPEELNAIVRDLGADGLARLAQAPMGSQVSPKAAASRSARSRRPTASTARHSGAARHRPPAKDPPTPPG
jgi:hypothetical protein